MAWFQTDSYGLADNVGRLGIWDRIYAILLLQKPLDLLSLRGIDGQEGLQRPIQFMSEFSNMPRERGPKEVRYCEIEDGKFQE